MNPTKTARIIDRYESGLLSASDLSSEPDLDTAFLATIELLPDAVKRALFRTAPKDSGRGFSLDPIPVDILFEFLRLG